MARSPDFFGNSAKGYSRSKSACVNVTARRGMLRERFGIEPIYPATRAGADGTSVNFFLVATPEGKKVLIELVESANHAER